MVTTNKKLRRLSKGVLFLCFSFLLPIILLPAQYASAENNIGGAPAYPRDDMPATETRFFHEIEVGEASEDGVRVMNYTTEVKTLMVYAVDASIASAGNIACGQLAEENTEVGSWVTLAKDEVVLQPSTREIVDFTIDVPEDASVGSHEGCIVIQEKHEEREAATSSGVQLSFRNGIRLTVIVPGDINRELEIVDFRHEVIDQQITITDDVTGETRQADGFNIIADVANVGNAALDSKLEITLVNILTNESMVFTDQVNILRDSTKNFSFSVPKSFWGGVYEAHLEVTYNSVEDNWEYTDNIKTLTSDISFFSLPNRYGLMTIGGVLTGLGGGFWWFFILWKRRKEYEEWVEYEIQPGDRLNDLADERDVKIKLVGKVNSLKPPYMVPVGSVVLLPILEDEEEAALRREQRKNAKPPIIERILPIARIKEFIASRSNKPMINDHAVQEEKPTVNRMQQEQVVADINNKPEEDLSNEVIHGAVSHWHTPNEDKPVEPISNTKLDSSPEPVQQQQPHQPSVIVNPVVSQPTHPPVQEPQVVSQQPYWSTGDLQGINPGFNNTHRPQVSLNPNMVQVNGPSEAHATQPFVQGVNEYNAHTINDVTGINNIASCEFCTHKYQTISSGDSTVFVCNNPTSQCKPSSISNDNIIDQVKKVLGGLRVPDQYIHFVQQLERPSNHTSSFQGGYAIAQTAGQRIQVIDDQKDKLLDLYLSSLIDKSLFASKITELDSLKVNLHTQGGRETSSLMSMLQMGNTAYETYINAIPQQKSELIQMVFKKLNLQDKNLIIELASPFNTVYQCNASGNWEPFIKLVTQNGNLAR